MRSVVSFDAFVPIQVLDVRSCQPDMRLAQILLDAKQVKARRDALAVAHRFELWVTVAGSCSEHDPAASFFMHHIKT